MFVSRKVENCTNRFIESCLFGKQYLLKKKKKKHVMYDLFFNTVLWYFTSEDEKERLIFVSMDFNRLEINACL